MDPAAATRLPGRSRLLFLLFLLRLLRGITAAPAGWVVGGTRGGAETDALLLSYNFSIRCQANPGQPWCEIQGQVNGNEFLSYACGSKQVTPVGPWGMKLKDTAFWGTQMEPLKYLGEELRKKLLDINAEFVTKNESLTMQGRLVCERGDGCTRESWQFAFNGQLTHRFDPGKGNWTVVSPGGQQFRGTLDNDKELTKLLVRTAKGDCKSWLQEVWEHWDEMRETTVPPTTQPDVVQTRNIGSPNVDIIFVVVIIVVVIIVVVIVVIISYIIIKNRHSLWNFVRRTGCCVHQEAPQRGDQLRDSTFGPAVLG